MSGNEKPTSTGSWSSKVNPKRAQAEAAEQKFKQNAEEVFAELFGAPDAELQAQMQESWNILAAIGQDILARKDSSDAATTNEGAAS